ncbi:hypothetical protein EVG20_g10549 [Dentipellis fragilis]|uniref:Uncharacterized protein n=1 Tax=Dentipellis fragilis TaxID=205917 RepID=A0A4Y9XV74_9AGAM|nr:hypothetical protein EVG20_g10549 [Dentipellis fragilis]
MSFNDTYNFAGNGPNADSEQMIYPELSLAPSPDLDLYPPGIGSGFDNDLLMGSIDMQSGWQQLTDANVAHVDEVLQGFLSHPEMGASHSHGPFGMTFPIQEHGSLLFSGNDVVQPTVGGWEGGQYIASNALNTQFQQQPVFEPSSLYGFTTGDLESPLEPVLGSQLFQMTPTFRSVDALHGQEQEQLMPPPPPRPPTIPLPAVPVPQPFHALSSPQPFYAPLHSQSSHTAPSHLPPPEPLSPAWLNHLETWHFPSASTSPTSATTALPTPLFEDNAALFPSSATTTPETVLAPELEADPKEARGIIVGSRVAEDKEKALPGHPGWLHVAPFSADVVSCILDCGVGLDGSRADCLTHLKAVHGLKAVEIKKGGKLVLGIPCCEPTCGHVNKCGEGEGKRGRSKRKGTARRVRKGHNEREGEEDEDSKRKREEVKKARALAEAFNRAARHWLETHHGFNRAMCTICGQVYTRAGGCQVTRNRHAKPCLGGLKTKQDKTRKTKCERPLLVGLLSPLTTSSERALGPAFYMY